MNTVAIRTGGSLKEGYGHVRRCLSLAAELNSCGLRPMFLLHGGARIEREVAREHWPIIPMPQPGDSDEIEAIAGYNPLMVIVDGYQFTDEYFQRLESEGMQVTVIDDLADRELNVSVVVNGSVDAAQLSYRRRSSAIYLLGAEYALLRSEFQRPVERLVKSSIARVLVTCGGSDNEGLSVRVVDTVFRTVPLATVDVIVGPQFADSLLDALMTMARWSGDRIRLHESPSHVWSLMAEADLAVCSGGQTTYELAAAGTPAIAVETAANQRGNLRGLQAAGTLIPAGNSADEDLEQSVERALRSLAGEPDRRVQMSHAGRALIDGFGARRVARTLVETLQAKA